MNAERRESDILQLTGVEVGAGPVNPEEYAEQINGEWRKTVEGIFGAGRWLIQAKAELEESEFLELIGRHGEGLLAFGYSTAYKLIAISTDQRLVSHVTLKLPPSWGTLHALSCLSDDEWRAIEPHLTPELQRGQIKRFLNAPSEPKSDTEQAEDREYPWPADDNWCIGLRNLFERAPKRSQARFRKWVSS